MKKLFVICMTLFALTGIACSDDKGVVDPDAPQPSFEVVESDEESSDSAWLYAEYNYEGQGTITEAGFAYKVRKSQDAYVDVPSDEWDQKGAMLELKGLDPETEYMYYCYVVIGGQEFNSLAMNFSTAEEGVDPSEPKPAFLAPAASDYTQTSASLSCVYSYKGDKEVTAAGFFYKKSGETNYVKAEAANTASPITCALTGLTAGTAYSYYAFVTIDGKDYSSSEESFSTKTEQGEVIPVFGTPYYHSVTTTTASIACNFTFEGTETISEVGFQYKSATASTYTKVSLTATTGDKSADLTGLAPSTSYSFYLYALIGGKTYQSEAGIFTTNAQAGGDVATKHSGWAELPNVQASVSDYNYVEHFCAMKSGKQARNFSACFSAGKKCPVWVAAPLHDAYAEKVVERKNSYKDDPDLPSSIQVGKWSGYTRGHMLGSAERLVSREANSQVMYFSNIGPQLGQGGYFNTGGGQWNTAEDWVDKQWRGLADTCYQVVGCYWANTSKVVSGTTIPTHYFTVLLKAKKNARSKWVVNCSRDELQCIALFIEHKNYSKSEVVKPENYASKGIFMSVEDLEKKTGHKFFMNVTNAPKDTYNQSDWNF